MAALRQLWHLITRFVGVVTSRPLGPRAQESVTRVLGETEAAVFWQQQSIDQRHAYEVAARVADSVGEDHPAVVAALLHDVGKRRSRLGAVERSLATVTSLARLPMPAAMEVLSGSRRDRCERIWRQSRLTRLLWLSPVGSRLGERTQRRGVVLEAADDASGLLPATAYRLSGRGKHLPTMGRVIPCRPR